MNNKPDSKVEVKCCPFCGHKPKLLDNLNVHCNNKMCVLYCRVFWHEHWNTRSPIANNGVSLEDIVDILEDVRTKSEKHWHGAYTALSIDQGKAIIAKLQPTAPRGAGEERS